MTQGNSENVQPSDHSATLVCLLRSKNIVQHDRTATHEYVLHVVKYQYYEETKPSRETIGKDSGIIRYVSTYVLLTSPGFHHRDTVSNSTGRAGLSLSVQ
eukprot:scpid104285/ scgid20696/ 